MRVAFRKNDSYWNGPFGSLGKLHRAQIMRTIGKQRNTSSALVSPGGKATHILLGACFMFLATVALAKFLMRGEVIE